ncbi:MAG: TlpA family protein disulfide reductase [Deltaproteobacteria bacterium]|nr:TlpA family protein disulfide reductase [Deltaproteobacteria bacterium]
MPYRYAVAAMLFLVCGAALAGPERLISGGGEAAATPGAGSDRPADFTLPDLDGRPVTLSRFLGKKPVLLVFWATWCPECKAAIPEINAMTTGPLAGKLQILGLDFRESREKVAYAVKARGIRYPVLLDLRGQAAREYGVVGIPTYILIDRRGRVSYRGHVLPGDLPRLTGS